MKRFESLLVLGLLFMIYAETQSGISEDVGRIVGLTYCARALWALWKGDEQSTP